MAARTVLLQTRVDASTAARVRLEAEGAGTTVSVWLAEVLRRVVAGAGAGDALAPKSYEVALTVGYMLRALMVESMGAEAAEKAIEVAADTAAEEAAAEVAHWKGEGG